MVYQRVTLHIVHVSQSAIVFSRFNNCSFCGQVFIYEDNIVFAVVPLQLSARSENLVSFSHLLSVT